MLSASGGRPQLRAAELPDYSKRIKEANKQAMSNFWQVGGFKEAVTRVDDGAVLLDDMSRMVLERAMIEKKFSQMLRAWSKKWDDKIDKNVEQQNGTLKPAWKALLSEADQLATVHESRDQSLREDISEGLHRWRKEHYPKQLRTIKVTKEAHDKFVKAQKPWAKLLKHQKKCRKQFFLDSANFESAKKKLAGSKSDPNISTEDVTKMQAKRDKLEQAVAESRKAYQTAVVELAADRGRYEDSMTKAFEFCQDLEQQRQDFMKTMMLRHQAILAVHTPEQCKVLKQLIDRINPDADLVYYAQTKGIGMTLCLPSFHEYGAAPTIEVINSSATKVESSGQLGRLGNGVKLVSLRRAQAGDFQGDDEDEHGSATTTDKDGPGGESDDEWEGGASWTPPPQPSASVGVKVRAIYDYVGEDKEELSFKAGDVLKQIEAEDEQGWCRGVHTSTGTSGLYPACYVEEVTGHDV